MTRIYSLIKKTTVVVLVDIISVSGISFKTKVSTVIIIFQTRVD